ncbi:hypothetical protein P691DRAFT_766988 [Macrolepiota fuliginosa MF-IS2]|uniref:EF-hand domain-containing protein n=1 Tax=Macrolepiota fuliginosa MF-IS2 TaxID=1400762 RepID=A0A9P5X054_9AGAR|nr:hypothetical protein P691DRAFT_766988 [Macrolepiota fuliginosa MF-IS2]
MPINTTPTPQDALSDAYATMKDSKVAPGKKEQCHDNQLSQMNKFFQENKENKGIINIALDGITQLDEMTVESAISGFSKTLNVILIGLDSLTQIHPFIGDTPAAVGAFKLVVMLDMTRKENNAKVRVLNMQLQQMMCTLFQLCQMQGPDHVMPDGMILKDCLQPLMEQIALDIKKYGSACDLYLRKSFIIWVFKSPIYEARLAEYATMFMNHRNSLTEALTIHIALATHTTHEKMNAQSSEIHAIGKNVERLFKTLRSSQEKELLEFVMNNRGPMGVIKENGLIEDLFKMSRELMANYTNDIPLGKSKVNLAKEKLWKEMAGDIELQGQNIEKALEKQGQYMKCVASILATDTHNRVTDVVLWDLWKRMGWRRSPGASKFVLCLYDYFTEHFSEEESDSPSLDYQDIQTTTSLPALVDDQWALEYLSPLNIHSIMEAIDDDGTGSISIKEANFFVNDHPQDWRLLHWIAFWEKVL